MVRHVGVKMPTTDPNEGEKRAPLPQLACKLSLRSVSWIDLQQDSLLSQKHAPVIPQNRDKPGKTCAKNETEKAAPQALFPLGSTDRLLQNRPLFQGPLVGPCRLNHENNRQQWRKPAATQIIFFRCRSLTPPFPPYPDHQCLFRALSPATRLRWPFSMSSSSGIWGDWADGFAQD